jgi:hypothetical protein|eukprot:CAMPEP_0174315274 /NCGR_PEP_ID=MMETSP0810-20121108/6184_1 /TAXON_ID=73025 ORGANISM="Eutreptiella gymnastica-like, Strain CCMP1594" /NCGR_SAMPLE_ID=MMETSP0810 /ASSEMBLY_ACC=CAM_ASM_000659 /LENGTH=70 /DNA_ID=CAMNT_0015424619 /DNA_START=139 /DNA_END=351 /DNA_ORIENTATION=-
MQSKKQPAENNIGFGTNKCHVQTSMDNLRDINLLCTRHTSSAPLNHELRTTIGKHLVETEQQQKKQDAAQ